MTYQSEAGGMDASDLSSGGRIEGEATFWTYALVEERLIEGMALWMRLPDRERAMQHVRALWPDTKESESWDRALGGELSSPAADKPEPRRPSLTRADHAEMGRVAEMFALVPADERRLVALALSARARGSRKVPWLRLLKALRLASGAGMLKTRYRRAIAIVALRLNGRSEAEAKRIAQRSRELSD